MKPDLEILRKEFWLWDNASDEIYENTTGSKLPVSATNTLINKTNFELWFQDTSWNQIYNSKKKIWEFDRQIFRETKIKSPSSRIRLKFSFSQSEVSSSV